MSNLISFADIDLCDDDSQGGCEASYVAQCKDLDLAAATFDDEGDVLTIPWANELGPSPYISITSPEDGSAYFNENYQQSNGQVIQNAFLKIVGLTAANVDAATRFKEPCCFVALHKLKTGLTRIQGVSKVWYDGAWHLVPTYIKNSAKTIELNSNNENESSNVQILLESISDCFSLSLSDQTSVTEVVTGDEDVAPQAPTIVLDGIFTTLVAPVVDTKGCSSGFVMKVTAEVAGAPSTRINVTSFPFNVYNAFCGVNAGVVSTSILITATIQTSCGVGSATKSYVCTTSAGIVNSVATIPCPVIPEPMGPPAVVIPTFTGIFAPEPTWTTNGCGSVVKTYLVAVSTLSGVVEHPITLGTAPYNIKDLLCGLEANNTTAVLKARITTACGTAEDTKPISLAVVSGFITAVQGVTCFDAPTIDLEVVDNNLTELIFHNNGHPSYSRYADLYVGTNLIGSLNPDWTLPLDLRAYVCGRQGTYESSLVKIVAYIVGPTFNQVNAEAIVTTTANGAYRITTVGGQPCPTLPTVSITPPVGTMLAEPTWGGSCAETANKIVKVRRYNFGPAPYYVDTIISSFPYDLSVFCGLESVANAMAIIATINGNCGDAERQINVPVTLGGDLITAVNGVSCAGIILPTVSLSLVDKTLTATWYDGGDTGAIKSLVIDNGTNSITLDSTAASIDLGDILYGIESAGANSQVYIVSAVITNSAGTANESLTCVVLTKSWSGGRFIYAVNSVVAPPPTVTGINIVGNTFSINSSIGIWKRFNIGVEYHWNPLGWASGEYRNEVSNALDNGVPIFSLDSLTSMYCGAVHIVDSPFIAIVVKVPLTPDSTFIGAPLPFTVDGDNLITSINGVSC
jgi:hypothetical protein